MDNFLNGFADELIKLGRASSPAEAQSRAQAKAALAPMPSSKSGPTKPIRQTRPGAMPDRPAIKVRRDQPIDPYKGKAARSAFVKSTPPTPGRKPLLPSDNQRPSNAMGATHRGLKALGPREWKLGPAKERLRARPSPKYQPKVAPKVEVEKKKIRVRKKKVEPSSGPKRLRRPGETGTTFLNRMTGNEAVGRQEVKQKANNEPWYMQASNPQQRKEILEKRKGTHEYKYKKRKEAEKRRWRDEQRRQDEIDNPPRKPNLRGYLMQ